jgi:hypothetical protein
MLTVPSNATYVNLTFKWRVATAPASAKAAVFRLFSRQLPDNAAAGSWSAGYQLTTLAVSTDAYYHYTTQTYTLATLSLTAGSLYNFELTRYASLAADTLVGDFLLVEFTVDFV